MRWIWTPKIRVFLCGCFPRLSFLGELLLYRVVCIHTNLFYLISMGQPACGAHEADLGRSFLNMDRVSSSTDWHSPAWTRPFISRTSRRARKVVDPGRGFASAADERWIPRDPHQRRREEVWRGWHDMVASSTYHIERGRPVCCVCHQHGVEKRTPYKDAHHAHDAAAPFFLTPRLASQSRS